MKLIVGNYYTDKFQSGLVYKAIKENGDTMELFCLTHNHTCYSEIECDDMLEIKDHQIAYINDKPYYKDNRSNELHNDIKALRDVETSFSVRIWGSCEQTKQRLKEPMEKLLKLIKSKEKELMELNNN